RPGNAFGSIVGAEYDHRVVVEPIVLELLHDRPDDVIKLRQAGFVDTPAVLGIAQPVVLLGQMGHDVHARGIEPDEEWLTVRFRLVDEVHAVRKNLIIHRLHALWIERPVVFDSLPADFAPAWMNAGIVLVARPAVQHVARPYLVLQRLWIGSM